jgi:spermidine synthase
MRFSPRKVGVNGNYTMQNIKSSILKACVFATGLSGIVAEYVLATLATYFIGNSILQWSLIVSVMMFSMGLGSRISRYIRNDLLISFIGIEFILSIFVAYSALITYSTAAFSPILPIVIYSLSIIVGLLIGMEIPIVIRLNKDYQILRLNISGVMEHDYYGSLLGGFFFSFVGLPYLGMTYTPIALGCVNFAVAIALIGITYSALPRSKRIGIFIWGGLVLITLISAFWTAKPIIRHSEQKKYKDKVIYQKQTKYQRIVMTQWKNDYWLYLNGNLQCASFDEAMYHEPLVHPVIKLAGNARDVLIIGGGDGCAVREILKHDFVESVTLVDLDPMMIEFAETFPPMVAINDSSFYNPKVKIETADGFNYLEDDSAFYDAIIVDLPDPRTIELSRMYSEEFYRIIKHKLRERGAFITQATSPYYARTSFRCIEKTVNAAGMEAVPMHNQVLTMGEWGWIIASKKHSAERTKDILRSMKYEDIETRWINADAMLQMTYFGKDYPGNLPDTIKTNTLNDPVLFRYYLKSNWDAY